MNPSYSTRGSGMATSLGLTVNNGLARACNPRCGGQRHAAGAASETLANCITQFVSHWSVPAGAIA